MTKDQREIQRKLLTQVLAASVKPFAPNGEDYGFLFLRSVVEAVFPSARKVNAI